MQGWGEGGGGLKAAETVKVSFHHAGPDPLPGAAWCSEQVEPALLEQICMKTENMFTPFTNGPGSQTAGEEEEEVGGHPKKCSDC